MPRSDLHEANRQSWNAATQAHNSHKGDQAAFLRDGGCTLFPEELELLGDLQGRTLLHALCNSGQDSLSLARRGATVTGVDISDEAIATAQRLSRDSGIGATFFRDDIYDWLASPPYGPFERIFLSYGAVYWLSDLKAFAKAAARLLSPKGGQLVIVEFHPTLWMFDDDWKLAYPYSSGGDPLTENEGVSDYVSRAPDGLVPWGYEPGVEGFENPHPAHGFPWGIGDILTALLEAGLTLKTFREYGHANGCSVLAGMTMDDQRRFHPPEGLPMVPLMFGLVAERT